jgi:hypothetical protein
MQKFWTGHQSFVKKYLNKKDHGQEVEPRMEAMRLEIMEMAKARQLDG